MSMYRYPVRYFYGSGIQSFPKQLLDDELEYFTQRCVACPLLGETGLANVLLDFNAGLRLQIPEGQWHVTICDHDSNLLLFDEDVSEVTLISAEKFFVRWEIAILLDCKVVFYHCFDPESQKIHFEFTGKALGDNIALFPYMKSFSKKYHCEVSCTVPDYLREIVQRYYPEVEILTEPSEDTYATFYLAAWVNMPFAAMEDPRTIPLAKIGESILRIPCDEKTPQYTPWKPRMIEQPYVCIAVQASMTSKAWLNPHGWDAVVNYLRGIGYRVLCIDRDVQNMSHDNVVRIPEGAENFTGNLPLAERVDLLAYADFFVGVSSGLSWLAWAVGIPVVLISGITARWYEFPSAYRVSNPLACHGCFNDLRVDFSKIESCACFEGTEQAFECQKKISEMQVLDAIRYLMNERNLTVASEQVIEGEAVK